MPNQVGTAYYRIGPSDFFTPGDLAADANTLNGQMNGLDQLDWTKAPDDLFNSWNSFLQEWRGFYSSSFGGFFTNLTTALNDSSRDQLIQFENRFATYASQYTAATSNQVPGGIVNASSGSQDTLGDQIRNQLQPIIPSVNVSHVLLIVGLVVAAGVVIYFRGPISRALRAGAG